MIVQEKDRSFRLGVVVLAAGASSRMGRPKLLLPWGATTVLGHLLTQWARLGSVRTAVVCAPAAPQLGEELDRLGVPFAHRIINPRPERGMFSSIQSAAGWPGWPPELSHWAIVLGDQPHLPLDLLQTLVTFTANHPQQACQPACRGRTRHPVLLPREVFVRLADSTEPTLKAFLGRTARGVALCPVENEAFELDLDTPADYQRALRQFPPAPFV